MSWYIGLMCQDLSSSGASEVASVRRRQKPGDQDSVQMASRLPTILSCLLRIQESEQEHPEDKGLGLVTGRTISSAASQERRLQGFPKHGQCPLQPVWT